MNGLGLSFPFHPLLGRTRIRQTRMPPGPEKPAATPCTWSGKQALSPTAPSPSHRGARSIPIRGLGVILVGMGRAFPLATGETCYRRHPIGYIFGYSWIFLQLPQRHWTMRVVSREPGLSACPHLHSLAESSQRGFNSRDCNRCILSQKGTRRSGSALIWGEFAKQ